MIELLGNIYSTPLYVDTYMEDNKILKGRKEGGLCFLIANPKTANILYKNFLIKIRKEKLEKLKNK